MIRHFRLSPISFGFAWMYAMLCSFACVCVYLAAHFFSFDCLGLLSFVLQFASSQKFTFAKDTSFFPSHLLHMHVFCYSISSVALRFRTARPYKTTDNRFSNGKPLQTKSTISNSIDDFILIVCNSNNISWTYRHWNPLLLSLHADTDALCISFHFISFYL